MLTDKGLPCFGRWNFGLERTDDGKPKWGTLQAKIFRYPRIALGVQCSPVKEGAEHVAWILDHERELRDAIVHPTPRGEAESSTIIREQTYFETDLATVRDLIDHAIGLIRYVDTLLGGKFGRVSIWLRDRGGAWGEGHGRRRL